MASLQFALHAQEEAASAVVIGERQVRPLQVGVLHRIRQILDRDEYTHMPVEVVAYLTIELPVRCLIDLADQLFTGCSRVRDGKRGADQGIVDRLIPPGIRGAGGEAEALVIQRPPPTMP